MGFVRLWPALLAVFIPGIILLYLLKQKVLNQKISALNLWKEAYENIQASTPWEKFRNNILMYMQIAALILLVTALMSPYITGHGSEYSNVLIIIDNSASMSGIYTDGQTKLDVAKEQAADYVSNNDDVRYTVMSASNTPDLLISGSSDKVRITDAIDNIEATDIAGSLENATSMAQSLAAAWKNYKVIAFTDSSANMQNINCEVVDLSVQGENAAIQSLSHTVSEDGTVKVMARIDNYGRSRFSTDVNLYMGKDLYDIQNVTTEPGESSIVYFKDIAAGRYNSILAGSTPYLMAEINSKDMLAGDNTAYDILNGEGDEKILLVSSKNTFLEKGLKVSGNRDMDKVLPKDLQAADTGEYSLVVYDGIIPGSIPEEGNIIFINPPVSKIKNLGDKKVKENDKWKQDIFIYAEKSKSSIVRTLNSNVTTYLDSYSFGCLDVTGFKTPQWAKSFFETDNKFTTGYLGNYNGRMVAVTGFDLHNTDFPLQTEFPIFMYNLLRETMSARIADKTIYSAGEAVSIQKKGKAEKAVIIKPGGSRETHSLDGGTAVFTDTLKAGLYNIKEGGDNVYFTVSFPEDESDVLKEAVITSDNKTITNTTKKLGSVLSKKMIVFPVLVLLLVLLMAEWMVYRKRL
ncbi:MAG: VWA domain-containing protein [Lachnospiraceae bacterium]|nr:VWA domain-containing protein [Lachnospiraceae bacterium]